MKPGAVEDFGAVGKSDETCPDDTLSRLRSSYVRSMIERYDSRRLPLTFGTSKRRESRRFQCYCVGTGKTGTHSVSGIFERSYRAAHEPECEQLISRILELGENLHSHDTPAFLRNRDERLFLELESDVTLFYFLEQLVDEFKQSKFILTIRDCYTWLDSVFNHNLAHRPSGFWQQFDDYQFAAWDFRHVEEERVLAEHGLRTLRHYLSHWTAHNQTVIATVPKERLLVVRTDDLDNSSGQFATFLGVPAHTIDLTRSHLFRNPKRFHLMSSIDSAFLDENVRRYCGPLMQEYFQEIDGYASVAHAR
jgi:Sulfotransferase domain